jgi:glyceraldehyde-3-phosphate dehydrogenase/erythrose-4-phosphate dehydrogenase
MGMLPGYRGRGIGERLLRASIDAARSAGFERIELSVYAANERAAALYRKVGFVMEGTRVRGKKLDGYAIRVPTINVSIVDLTFIAARDTTVDEVNAVMKAASETGPLAGGILRYNTAPLVSVDFNHDPASSTFDSTLTKVSGRLVKVSSWYDNEWGFSNRMLDVTTAWMGVR